MKRQRPRDLLARLRARPLPEWYGDAKLGIFIHWGLASVPGFAPRERDIRELIRERYDDLLPLSPYTEWYENALRFPWSPTARYHRERYGDRAYADFRRDFERGLELWHPEEWARRFATAGARYVVLVTKHHDGYCLWPSAVPHPARPGWQVRRDVVGELGRAVRAAGMRFGVYYSGGIDWSFEPRPVRTMLEFVASMPRGPYADHAEAHVRELVRRYRPAVLWNDIAWPTDRPRLWRLMADYYDAVPEGVVNDRWLTPGWLLATLRLRPARALLDAALKRAVARSGPGPGPPPPPHFDFRTPEYAVFPDIRSEKWECVRGMDKSFGYNRASLEEDFVGHEELIHSFADIVSKNGNLLLNVGPRGEDAALPEPQLRRLEWLGRWLERNGEAIYGSRPWRRAEATADGGLALRFTARGPDLFAIALGTPPPGELRIAGVRAESATTAEWLGAGPAAVRATGSGIAVTVPPGLPAEPAHVLALRGAA